MIRYIFERYASGKVGTKKLGDELYEKGYTNRKGGVLHSKTIQSIIQNPKYKGYYCGGKVVVEDMFTKKNSAFFRKANGYFIRMMEQLSLQLFLKNSGIVQTKC